MKCELCGKEIQPSEAHNGQPLVNGKVCSSCNWKVIRERLRRANSIRKETLSSMPAEESIAVVGTDIPVSDKDPMADFEKYAKEFEEMFVLGETPVRKESAQNKTKVSGGEVTGEVSSLDKGEKNEQVQPIKEKSATESLVVNGDVSGDDFSTTIKMAIECGFNMLEDFEKFLKNYAKPNEKPMDALIRYKASLGGK